MGWERVVASERLLVALDFDGTIAPIVPRPEAARAAPAMIDAITRLAALPGTKLAIVSGRDAFDLSSRVDGLPPLWIAGGHGRELLAPGACPVQRIQDARLEEYRTMPIPSGMRRELKDASVAFHWRGRGAGEPAGWVHDIVVRAIGAGLEVLEGRQVVEILLPGSGKAHALVRLREATNSDAILYAGDDRTDQEAICEAQATGGVGIFVRSAELAWIPPSGVLVVDGVEQLAAKLGDLAGSREERLRPSR